MRNGKFLYYVKRSRIWKVPLGGGQETQAIEEKLSHDCNLALVEDGLYFVAASGYYSPGILYLFDFATGGLTPVTTIRNWFLGLAVSPDRRSILYSQLEQSSASLMLVENFR